MDMSGKVANFNNSVCFDHLYGRDIQADGEPLLDARKVSMSDCLLFMGLILFLGDDQQHGGVCTGKGDSVNGRPLCAQFVANLLRRQNKRFIGIQLLSEYLNGIVTLTQLLLGGRQPVAHDLRLVQPVNFDGGIFLEEYLCMQDPVFLCVRIELCT